VSICQIGDAEREMTFFLWGKWVISNTGTSKNFVACYIENKATITSNLTPTFLTSTVKQCQTGSPCGVGGWGVTADDDRGCYDPV